MANKLSDEEIEFLRDQFKELDTSNDDKLDVKEMGTFLRLAKQNPTDEDIKNFHQALDTDENGFVDFEEFLAVYGDLASPHPDEDLLEAFKMLDKNGNGKLERSELKQILMSPNCDKEGQQTEKGDEEGDDYLTEKSIQEFLDEADTDEDGCVSLAEWCASSSQGLQITNSIPQLAAPTIYC